MSMAMAQQILKLERAVADLTDKLARIEAYLAVERREVIAEPERRGPVRPRKDTLHLTGSA